MAKGMNKDGILKLMSEIDKKEKGSVYSLGSKSDALKIPRWSTGLVDLDNIIGGGVPKGRVIEIFGAESAGKTTLIKKLIAEAYQNEKIVLIENEFGEIGIDGTFLKDSGVTINEMNSGCICCSLVGDFETSLKEVLDTYHPDRVIIEPSGVGKLSDVIKAVSTINSDEMELDNFITVVDAKKCRMYTKNFGEFYNNQVEHASLIVLSRSQDLTEFQLKECLDILKGLNDHSPIITTAWDKLNGLDIINACEVNIQEELLHEHDHECCGHDHHEHDHECGCGHHHHHADEVFNSIGFDTVKKYNEVELSDILNKLCNDDNVLRAKGFVDSGNEDWWYFDLVPGEFEIRLGKPIYTGQVCVIGKDLDENTIKELFLG